MAYLTRGGNTGEVSISVDMATSAGRVGLERSGRPYRDQAGTSAETAHLISIRFCASAPKLLNRRSLVSVQHRNPGGFCTELHTVSGRQLLKEAAEYGRMGMSLVEVSSEISGEPGLLGMSAEEVRCSRRS